MSKQKAPHTVDCCTDEAIADVSSMNGQATPTSDASAHQKGGDHPICAQTEVHASTDAQTQNQEEQTADASDAKEMSCDSQALHPLHDNTPAAAHPQMDDTQVNAISKTKTTDASASAPQIGEDTNTSEADHSLHEVEQQKSSEKTAALPSEASDFSDASNASGASDTSDEADEACEATVEAHDEQNAKDRSDALPSTLFADQFGADSKSGATDSPKTAEAELEGTQVDEEIPHQDDPASTNDLIEAARILQSNDPSTTAEFAPIPLTPQQLKERKDAAKAAKKAAKQPLNWYAISDVGLVRDHNEDSYLAHPPLFAVCDGMGGHAAGEVASAIAIDAICRNAPVTADDVALGAAIEAANTAVIEGASSGRGKEGMGCTATCCIIKDERIAIAHVGDSRCYILHNGIMTRMTEDHSLVEDLVKSGSISADEARDHRYRSIITRALGSEPDMYADHLSTTIDRGDRILLCSDGLSSMVSDYMIERTLCQDADAQATCEALLQQALEAGGHDNVTIVVIDVASDVQRKRATKKTLKAVAFWLIGVVVACAILVAAAALYINQTYFLTTVNNHVTVYQGVPGQIMGMPLNHLQNETTIMADDLPASVQQNLHETISVSSKEEADKLLDEYRKHSDEKKLKDAEKRKRSKESQGGGQ